MVLIKPSSTLFNTALVVVVIVLLCLDDIDGVLGLPSLKAMAQKRSASKSSIIEGFHVSKRLQCRESRSLDEREDAAEAVFSGTVRVVYPSSSERKLKSAKVEIKRVLKGGELIERVSTREGVGVGVSRFVIIDGLGDPSMCDTVARRNDTRIFMVVQSHRGDGGEGGERVTPGGLRLSSSLVRMSLGNIEHAEAAIKGK